MLRFFWILLVLVVSTKVLANTQNAGLNNQASVTAVCMISADNLEFGEYNPLSGSDVTANTNVYVTCVNGATYYVYLNAGLHSGSDILNRKMLGASSGGLLSYQLYSNPSVSGAVWGDGSSGTEIQCAVGTGAQGQLIVYGKIFANQVTTPVDTYSDVITVTVSY